MKRLPMILCILALLASAAPASAQVRYGWTLSESASDWCINQGTPNFGVKTIYLWHTFAVAVDNMAAADLSAGGSLVPLAFNSTNGYLNAGDAVNLLLAVGGCPTPPVLAGSFLIIDVGGNMFLTGARLTVDCVVNIAYPSATTGWSSDGSEPVEFDGGACLIGDYVEPESWSRVKGMFR